MDTLLLAVLVVGTLVVCYFLLIKVAREAGEKYPANVRLPAIGAAVGILSAGTVLALQLFGVLGTGMPFQISLSVALILTLGAM